MPFLEHVDVESLQRLLLVRHVDLVHHWTHLLLLPTDLVGALPLCQQFVGNSNRTSRFKTLLSG